MRDSQVRFIRTLGYPESEFSDRLYSALMFQPRIVGTTVAIGTVFQSAGLFLALSAALLWSTAFPTRHLFDALYNRVVASRRGLPRLGLAPTPRRFAQGMAGSIALGIAVALFMGTTIVAWIFEGVLLVAVLGVIFRDSCAGADIYHLLRRALGQPAQGQHAGRTGGTVV